MSLWKGNENTDERKTTTWRRVTSREPEGSVLTLILFLVYVSNMLQDINCYISLFTDNATLLRRTRSEEDTNALYEWSKTFDTELNLKKSHKLEVGKSERKSY